MVPRNKNYLLYGVKNPPSPNRRALLVVLVWLLLLTLPLIGCGPDNERFSEKACFDQSGQRINCSN